MMLVLIFFFLSGNKYVFLNIDFLERSDSSLSSTCL